MLAFDSTPTPYVAGPIGAFTAIEHSQRTEDRQRTEHRGRSDRRARRYVCCLQAPGPREPARRRHREKGNNGQRRRKDQSDGDARSWYVLSVSSEGLGLELGALSGMLPLYNAKTRQPKTRQGRRPPHLQMIYAHL